MPTSLDPLTAKMVRDLHTKIKRQIAIDFYHHFNDQLTVREVAEFVGMDFAQFHRLYREKYPATS